jgi:hypothetical protein
MRYFIYSFLVLSLASCSRGCASLNKELQTSSREYEIIMYSGGKVVFHDKVHTIINSEKDSDGIYYYKGDTLIEVSGDYILKSVK